MSYSIVRKPSMNRLYITGDVERAALASEAEYQAKIAAALAEWDAARAVIPADYKTRHGAMYGGVVSIGGEQISEPGITAPKVPWQHIATHNTRARDLTGQSTINGRVKDSQSLYQAVTDDGRPIYRIAVSRDFGDDLRETYYLPADLWDQMMRAEVQMRGITVEQAEQWLARYRGCVGTELYEFAMSAPASSSLALRCASAIEAPQTSTEVK